MLVGAVTWFVFSSLPPVGVFHQATIYVIFPFVIWAALRFEQPGATIAIAIVSGYRDMGHISRDGAVLFGIQER